MKVYVTHVAYVERVYCVDVEDENDVDLDEIELGKPIAEIDTEDEPNEYDFYAKKDLPLYILNAIK
jgi:hypothetical protein